MGADASLAHQVAARWEEKKRKKLSATSHSRFLQEHCLAVKCTPPGDSQPALVRYNPRLVVHSLHISSTSNVWERTHTPQLGMETALVSPSMTYSTPPLPCLGSSWICSESLAIHDQLGVIATPQRMKINWKTKNKKKKPLISSCSNL